MLFEQEIFCKSKCQNGCLSDQALVFGIGIAQRVMSAIARQHMAEDITILDFQLACPDLAISYQ